MFRFRFFLLIGVLLLLCNATSAQLMKRGMPQGLKENDRPVRIEFRQVPQQDVVRYIEEDRVMDTIADIPWRFGENIEVDISPGNSGTWENQPDGGRMWTTGVESPGAISLNFVFNPFRLPEGAMLYIYSPDGRQILGAFDHRNNQEDGYFATSLIFSDSVVIEYYEPADVAFEGELRLAQLTYGYRHPKIFTDKVFGESGSCNININCDVAKAYADQKRSVAMLLVGSNSFCTGTLINNARNDGTPYILSANHCYRTPSTVVFWFNWESEDCVNPLLSPAYSSLSGAVNVARFPYNSTTKTGTDLWLMKMNHIPPFEYNLFYSGWSRQTNPLEIDSVVTIHHPKGDIKKFSWSTKVLEQWGYGGTQDTFQTHWRVSSWDAGTTTEGGSSGSALFDHNGRIIGHLHGGQAACGNELPDYYGRLSQSWDGGGTSVTRLSNWLDPDGLSPLIIDGYQPTYYHVATSVSNSDYGTITPSAYIMENHGHLVEVQPQEGYYIDDVIINGESVGASSTIVLGSVTKDYIIHAIIQPVRFTITATSGGHGTINPSGTIEVSMGDTLTFNFTPDKNYTLASVVVDGAIVGNSDFYTFENISDSHTIHVTFDAVNKWVITATADTTGIIEPMGEIIVDEGADMTFSISPSPGYLIKDVLVDGVSVGAADSVTFFNVIKNHSVHAHFEAIPIYTISATTGSNGSIFPSGTILVEEGSQQQFSIVPDKGYFILDVFVNSVSIGGVNELLLENIKADYEILVVFDIIRYTATFEIAGDDGQPIVDALITLDSLEYEAGVYLFKELIPGSYAYKVSRSNFFPTSGNLKIDSSDVVQKVTLVADYTNVSSSDTVPVKVYPNPAGTFLKISSQENILAIRLWDTGGREMLVKEVESSAVEIDTSALPAGLYFLEVQVEGGLVHQKIQVHH